MCLLISVPHNGKARCGNEQAPAVAIHMLQCDAFAAGADNFRLSCFPEGQHGSGICFPDQIVTVVDAAPIAFVVEDGDIAAASSVLSRRFGEKCISMC